MRAIILAAGKGTRLGNLTKDKPKGMLEINGKTILEHQIEIFESLGIDDIVIVRGHCKEKISFKHVKYIDNDLYASTNMIESLICAKKYFDDDCIISYSDILFTTHLLTSLLSNSNDIVVSVDSNWREYWFKRYGKCDYDIENLKIKNDHIIEIGQDCYNEKNIDHRYIGINKFTKTGLKKLLKVYDEKLQKKTKWDASNNEFSQGYITDILQELINNKNNIVPNYMKNNWLEIDSKSDYELAKKIYANNFIL